MSADAPFARRGPPVHRCLELAASASLNPSATAFRLFLVGRVAENNSNLLFFLHDVGFTSRFGDRASLHKDFFLDVGISESVCDEESHLRHVCHFAGLWFDERLHFGDKPKLRHREGAKLKLEADEPVCCCLDCFRY